MNMKLNARQFSGGVCLAALAILSACSLKQDPLADKADLLRSATPKPPVVQKPDPIDSQNMVIDAPDQKSFLEGTESSFDVQSRVLIPGYDLIQVTIDNLDTFKDASYDGATGHFKWTPAVGFSGADPFRQVKMVLRAVAISTKDSTKVPLSRSASVTVMVQKNPQAPAIDRVNGLGSTLREDSTSYFYVRVKDPDSAGQTGKEPTLMFMAPDSGNLNLAPFVTLYSASYESSDKVWSFSLKLNLDHELTDSSKRGGFKIVAVSNYGKRSPEYDFTTKVFTKLEDPETSWKDGQVLKPGVENHINFIVYDPKYEGVLSLESKTIPMGSTMSCNSASQSHILECEFIYTPVGVPQQEVSGSVRFNVKSANSDTSDSKTANQNFNISFTVEALPKVGGQ